jgi:2-oxoglutarate ferredoxin oxidoreductase subunit alpha
LTSSDKRDAVLTGEHFWQGNIALAEGAIAAGCRFFAGYPITPASEIEERMTERLPFLSGTAIQMEDEIASMVAVLGASWGGVKSMTATSGPGFSLMMENLGLGMMMECPCVLANVMRGGPSTGLPTHWGQADVMQAKWGSHGDYGVIALCPDSPQECFDLTVEAFNLSEQYRMPVLILSDAAVGHMTEKVVIPPADKIKIYPRRLTKKKPGKYLPFQPGPDLVPDMVNAGMGYRIHVTGLTHDERGYPDMSEAAQDRLVRRLVDKIRKNADKIIRVEERNTKDADVVVVSYGISSRIIEPVVEKAAEEGIKVGVLRLITIWPFAEKYVRRLSERVKGFVMVELNYGQIFYEVERCACAKAKVLLQEHMGGGIPTTEQILSKVIEAAK